MKKTKMISLLTILVLAVCLIGHASGVAKAEADIPRGGQLRLAMGGQPPSLDPLMSTTTVNAQLANHIFETLVAYNAEQEVVPMLAEKYEISADGKVYTFYLRKGVKFHNGKEMTAEDVVVSMERWLDRSTSAKTVVKKAVFEEVDKYTVRMVVEHPSVLIPQALAHVVQAAAIMPKEIVESAGPTGVAEFIGTGPYKFDEWKQDQYIRLVRYEEYQQSPLPSSGYSGQKHAYVDEILFDHAPDPSTQLAGIQTGMYDEVGVHPDSYDMVKNDPNLEFPTPDYNSSGVILLNKNQGPMTNPKIRKAVQTIVDNEEILIVTAGNFYKLESSFMLKNTPFWYSEAGSEFYNQMDAKRAKQLLQEAGYDGEEIVLITSRDYEMAYNGTVVLQQQLEKIGIKTRIQVFDWPTLIDRVYNHPDLWDVYFIVNPIVPTPLDIIYFSEGFFTGPLDQKSKDLLVEIRNAPSLDMAKEYWDQLQEYSLAEFVPYIKIGAYSDGLRATRKGVHGGYNFLGLRLYWNVYKTID
ncbi:MAG TPA: ABC transporter substrate-binding protein [Firmicutes bacterium]|nr:ABC transporter substrate-binding protein [Bacillota bacterium]